MAASNLLRFFRKALLGNQNRPARQPVARTWPRFRPALETLEAREVPTVVNLSGFISANTTYSNTADSYVVNGNLTIDNGFTVTFGAGVNVTIDSGYTMTVDGTLNVTKPASFVAQESNYSPPLGIIVNGTMTAVNTTFALSGSVYEPDVGLTVNASGHLKASGSTFAWQQLILANGSVLNSGDLSGDTFKTTLSVPALDIPLLTGNTSFETVDINANSAMPATLALDTLATGQTYAFAGAFSIPAGDTMNVGAGAAVFIDAGAIVTVTGTLTAASKSSFTAVETSFSNQGIVVDGTMTLTQATFPLPSTAYGSLSSITVNAGGHLKSSGSTFNWEQLNLANGSVLFSGDLATNNFNTLLSVPALDIPLLAGNTSFQNVDINANSTMPATLNLSSLGGSGQTYIFVGAFTIPAGDTMNVKAGASVTIDAGVFVTVNGTLNVTSAASFMAGEAYPTTQGIVVNGTMKAVSTTFALSSTNGSSSTSLTVNSGGHLKASGSTFDWEQVTLANGSVLNSGDLSSDSFDDTLSVPALDIPLLTGNTQFQAVDINANSAMPATLALNSLGAGQSYVFVGAFDIPTGDTMNVAAGANVVIDPGAFVTVDGTLNVTSPASFTAVESYAHSQGIIVNGTMTADSTNFALTPSSGGTSLTVTGGGTLSFDGDEFNWEQLILNASSVDTMQYTLLNGQLAVDNAATITINQNDFTVATIVASGTSAPTIDLSNNYWATANSATIQAQITDSYTNASLPTVDFLPVSAARPAQVAAAPATIGYSKIGQNVALSATVTSPTQVVNVGTATFTILKGGTVVGTPVQVGVFSGVASTLYQLPPGEAGGTYTIKVVYSDSSSTFNDATDTSHTLLITGAATVATAPNSTATYSSGSQVVGLSATVTSVGGTVSQGTMTFTVLNGATPVGTAVSGNVVSGAVSVNYTLPGTAKGTYTIEAVYNGTTDFAMTTTTTATLTVGVAPTVKTQPAKKTVNAGSNITFTAAANGSPAPTVQWELSTNGGTAFTAITNGGVYTGATTGALIITGATATMNGYQYEAVFTNALGDVTTSAAALTVDVPPAITTQPASKTIDAGGNTKISAAASGNPAPTVKWEVSTNGGTMFTALSNGGVYNGVTTRTLTITGAPATMNGDEYQALFTNSVSTATTSAATLTVDVAPAVTTQPGGTTVNAGGSTSFTAAASGRPTPGVQWKVSSNGGTTFTTLTNSTLYSGVTTATLKITGAIKSMTGDKYEAVFTNSVGKVTTSAAALTVDVAPTITSQPVGKTLDAGGSTTFAAAASGNPAPTVKWKVSSNGGTTFTTLSNGGVYGGVTTGTLTITGATAAMNGDEYQAVFTNSVSTATTKAATLTIDTAPAITTQPGGKTVDAGGSTTLSATASGRPTPSVQWKVSSNGGTTFTPLTNSAIYSGVTTATLKITGALKSMNGDKYEAVFTNSVGKATTGAALLTVDVAPAITTQASSKTVAAGGVISFIAAASGNPAPTVRWKVSPPSGTSFAALSNGGVYSGATTDTLTITGATAAMTGLKYEAVFTNSVSTATTNVATLTVDVAPAVTTQPVNETINSGGGTTFTAAASGKPTPSVQWKVSSNGGTTFNALTNSAICSGVTTGTLTVAGALNSMNGDKYEAVFTNAAGTVATSAATLTVDFAPAITTQPGSTTVAAGSNASFTVVYSGSPAPSIQWEVSSDSGATFTALTNTGGYSGVTTGTLTIAATLALNGYEYRAVLANSLGSVTTADVTLLVV